MLLLIGFLLVLNLLPAITDTAFFRGTVAGLISEKLNGAEVRLGTLRVAPLKERVLVLEDFALAPPSRLGDPVMTLRSAECRWLLRDLADGVFHVTELTADGLHLRARREDGDWDVLSLLPPSSDEPFDPEVLRLPLPVQLDRVALTDSRVKVNAPGFVEARVSDLSARGNARLHGLLEGRASLDLSVGHVTASAAPGSVQLAEGLQANGRVSNAAGRVLATAGFEVPDLAGGLEDVLGLRSLPMEGAVGLEANVPGLELPHLDAYLLAGEFLDDRLSLSVTGGPTYDVRLTNRAAVDFAAFRELIEAPEAPAVSLSGTTAAVTDIGGIMRFGAGFSGFLDVRNSVEVAGVEAGAEFSDPPVSGAVDGVRALAYQDAQVHLSPTPTGLARMDLTAGAESLTGAFADVASVTAEEVRSEVALQATLLRLARVDAHGSLSAATFGGQSPRFGGLSLPVEAGFRLAADDMLDADRRGVAVEEAHAQLGEVVPRAWLAARVAEGLAAASATGGGIAEVGRALELVEALPEELQDVLPELALSGSVGGAFDLQVASPLTADRAANVHVDSAADLEGIDVRHPAAEVKLGRVYGRATAAARLDGALLPYGIRLGADGALAGFEGGMLSPDTGEPVASASVDSAHAEFSVGVPDVGLRGVTAEASGGAEGARAALLREGGSVLQVSPADIVAEGKLTATPPAGDLSLSGVRCTVPGELEAELPLLRLKGLGVEELAVNGRFALPNLRALVVRAAASLPEPLAPYMPEVSGRAEGELAVRGKLPVVDELLGAMPAGGFPDLQVLPLGDFYREKAPLDVEARFAVDDLSVLRDVSGTAAGVRDVAMKSDFALREGDVTAGAELTVPVVEFAPSPVPLRDFRLMSSLALRDFDTLETARFRFSGPGDVMEAEGTLSADGLASFRGVPTAGEMLRRLSLEARSTGALRPGRLAVVEGLEASGEVAWDFRAGLAPGDHLAFRLVPELREVSAGFRNLAAVKGLAGQAVFEKRWDIVEARPEPPSLSRALVARRPAAAGEDLRGRLSDFATAVDELLARPQQIVLESASALGMSLVESLKVEVTARGAALSVPRFYLRPLGGKVVGRLSVAPGDGGREVRMQGEFDGVDFRLLLPPELRNFAGDSTVGGNFACSAVVSAGRSEAHNPLKEISGRAEITHIGREALDRLLLALDPGGERPSIVRVRNALKLGSPRRVTARLERGFLSLNVELRGVASGLVSEYSIPRFNIAEAFASPMVTGVFDRLSLAFSVFDALDADAMEVAPDGSVRFVRRGDDSVAPEERP